MTTKKPAAVKPRVQYTIYKLTNELE